MVDDDARRKLQGLGMGGDPDLKRRYWDLVHAEQSRQEARERATRECLALAELRRIAQAVQAKVEHEADIGRAKNASKAKPTPPDPAPREAGGVALSPDKITMPQAGGPAATVPAGSSETLAATCEPSTAASDTAGAEASPDNPQLEDDAWRILRQIVSSPTRLKQADLTGCRKPSLDRSTVSRHLATLVKHGLIDYNPKNKKGAGKLPAGERLVKTQPK